MQPLQVYENILFKNISHITSIELVLRVLYYTLPGRFQDTKFASQTIYSVLNLIKLYHNTILRRAADQVRLQKLNTNGIEESQFNKYKRYWCNKSRFYRVISRTLSVIAYTQVWMEMGLLRQGFRKSHYQWIAGLELIKSILNLAIFRITNRRMNLYPNHTVRDVTPSYLSPPQHQQLQQKAPYWTGQRTGKNIPLLTTMIKASGKQKNQQVQTIIEGTEVNDYLMGKVLTAEKLQHPQQMVRAMNIWAGGAEIVSIMRPTIYVFAILVWGRRSWKPWYLSLSIDLLSNFGIQQNGVGRYCMLSLETNEYQRRLKLMALYLMKGAFYIWVTRPKLERLCSHFEDKPLANIFLVICRDYLSLWENIYFYSSGS
ncbi:peroxisome membrane protein [Absidia repens]|uniref:Peroxisomal membrane protein PEX16 n=1 Tax=Absidia repens TaxID=90262 RepID=A0A1X2IYF2_9FUNG|nr:peroxisome membrane protein [Absidia repens]